ncbi:MAG: phosphoribosylanthranilate isomerase [Bacteroidota bacterium]
MALKTFVKVSGVNNLSDARYCAGMGVDLIGFNLDQSDPNFTSVDKFKEISDWLSGVEFVGEFGNSTLDQIVNGLNQYNLSAIEVNDYTLLKDLKNVKTILRIDIEELYTVPHDLKIDFLVVESRQWPSPMQMDQINKRTIGVKVLLDCIATQQNVYELLELTDIHGISLTAGDEIRPGYKDYDELAEVLEALEEEEY